MIDYKALAGRVAQRVIYADNNADPSNKGWAADLRAVVSLLNGMAEAQPVAWMFPRRYGCGLDFRKPDEYKDEEGNIVRPTALYTHPAPAVPAGWKVVPVEPTPEMLSAVGMMDGYDWHAPGCSPDADHANWYSAMIAAAPAAPQAEPKREPLSDEQIDEEATNRQMTAACEDAFYDGVRWAEHSHGIGGSDAE